MATCEGVAPSIQGCHALAASLSGTLEPRPLSAVVAWRVKKLNPVLPPVRGALICWFVAKHDGIVGRVSLDTTCLHTAAVPTHRELPARDEESHPAHVPNIELVALVGGALAPVSANVTAVTGPRKAREP